MTNSTVRCLHPSLQRQWQSCRADHREQICQAAWRVHLVDRSVPQSIKQQSGITASASSTAAAAAAAIAALTDLSLDLLTANQQTEWQSFSYDRDVTQVTFFFTDHIALSKNLPFFFTYRNNPIKMFRILFLRSDRSDQSDLARSKATERLDKPAQFRLFTFSLLIFPNLCGIFFRRFNRNNLCNNFLFTFIRPKGQQQQHHRYLHRH